MTCLRAVNSSVAAEEEREEEEDDDDEANAAVRAYTSGLAGAGATVLLTILYRLYEWR